MESFIAGCLGGLYWIYLVNFIDFIDFISGILRLFDQLLTSIPHFRDSDVLLKGLEVKEILQDMDGDLSPTTLISVNS